MAAVDWINWKTEPKEIMNPDLVSEKANEIFRDYYVYMNSVVRENIKFEINRGGLDQNSLNLLGENPAYEKAKMIINHIDQVKEKIEVLKKEIVQSAEEQKRLEKEQLINCIENKLKEEELKKQNTISLKNRLPENNTYITKEEVEEIIDSTEDRIKRLQERLDTARMI